MPGIWAVGLAVLARASALGIWSGVIMSVAGDGTPLPAAMANRLVVAGPFRFIRNSHEGADLERRFGDDYRRYRDRVRCWVPRLPARKLRVLSR